MSDDVMVMFNLRLPISLKRQVETLAKEKKWSLSTWLRDAVEKEVESQQKEVSHG